jgi:hypothetical protein
MKMSVPSECKKRQRAAALQDLSEILVTKDIREASWSAAALCRFRPNQLCDKKFHSAINR